MPDSPRTPRLMLVTDARRSRLPMPDLVAEAVAGGVDCVYLRDADSAAGDVAALVRAAPERIGGGDEGAACRAPTMRLMVNGDPGIAHTLEVGLHLRGRDMAAAAARAVLGPDIWIGKSVHTVAGARAATGADYLLAGHVYPSASKPGRAPLGLAGFAAIAAAAPCPTLAIGGITAERVADVVRAGAAGIAVIGAIAEAADPRAAAAALHAALVTATRNHERETSMTEDAGAPHSAASLTIVVNGKPETVLTDATVHDFLASKRMTDAMAIVERNGVIVPRAAYGTTALRAGDHLEVVHAVGGG